MIDYSLGKIYKIVGNGKTYIGSTTRPLLSQRLAKHKEGYKAWKNNKYHYVTSFDCIDDHNCYIELLEAFPCSSKNDLLKCEGKWIRETVCVNKLIPSGLLPATHHKEYHKEYYQANKEKIKGYQKSKSKEYYEANKDKIKEYMKDYNKMYYQKNKILANIGDGEVAPTPQ